MSDEELIKKIKNEPDIEKKFEIYKQIKSDQYKYLGLKYIDSKYYLQALKSFEKDEEKIKSLTCLTNIAEQISLIESLKSDEIKLDTLKTMKGKQETYKLRVVESLKEDKNKEKALVHLYDEYIKALAIKSIKDENIRLKHIKKIELDENILIIVNSLTNDEDKIKCLMYFKDDKKAVEVIKTFKSDKLKNKMIKEYSDYKKTIVLSFNDDKYKMNKITEFKTIYRDGYYEYDDLDIILSLKEDKNKLVFYNDYAYKGCKADILASIKNENIIISEFNKYNKKDTISLCVMIINKLKNETLKKQLIKNLCDKKYQLLFESNNKKIKEKLIKKSKKVELKNIDKNISFGVELEAAGLKQPEYLSIEQIFGDWIIKSEGSIDKGIEIASPILHNNEKDIKLLNIVCNILQEDGFVTNNQCGGHIHIGGDYLKTVDEYKMLYYIYSNCEEIFKKIFNKEGTTPRKNVKNFAPQIRTNLKKAIKNETFEEITSIKDFCDKMNIVQNNERTSLNIKNMILNKKTIEIRVPNGELDSNELYNNIYLFAKLMEKSKEYAKTKDEQKLKILKKLSSRKIPEKEKTKILLDILFEESKEKEIFENRYQKNERIIYKLMPSKNTIYYELENKNKKIKR